MTTSTTYSAFVNELLGIESNFLGQIAEKTVWDCDVTSLCEDELLTL